MKCMKHVSVGDIITNGDYTEYHKVEKVNIKSVRLKGLLDKWTKKDLEDNGYIIADPNSPKLLLKIDDLLRRIEEHRDPLRRLMPKSKNTQFYKLDGPSWNRTLGRLLKDLENYRRFLG